MAYKTDWSTGTDFYQTDWNTGTDFHPERAERAGWVTGFAVAIIVLLLVFTSIDPSNPEGGESGHHGPVPAGVTTLAPDEYFIDDDSAATVQEICLGGDEDTDGNFIQVEQSAKVAGHGTVVECVQDQRWNVRAEGGEDITYWQALVQQAQNPLIVVAEALALQAILVAWLLAVPDFFQWLGWRRSNRITNEQRVRELNRALAEDPEFNANMYDEGLRKLYRLGLKPAKD